WNLGPVPFDSPLGTRGNLLGEAPGRQPTSPRTEGEVVHKRGAFFNRSSTARKIPRLRRREIAPPDASSPGMASNLTRRAPVEKSLLHNDGAALSTGSPEFPPSVHKRLSHIPSKSCPTPSSTRSIPSSALPSPTAKGRCSSWPAPVRGRRAFSRTASPT